MSEHDKDIIFRMGVLILILMLVQLSVIGYVFYSSYQGRVDLVQTQRAGCERGKLDRGANAKGWRIAQQRALSQDQPQFAVRYNKIAEGLEDRASINCRTVFPNAGVFP